MKREEECKRCVYNLRKCSQLSQRPVTIWHSSHIFVFCGRQKISLQASQNAYDYFFFPFFKFEVSVKLSFWISTCHRNLHELTDKHRTVINTLASSVLYASFELHLLVFVLVVRMNSCCYRVLNCCTVVYLTLTLSLKSFSVLLQSRWSDSLYV